MNNAIDLLKKIIIVTNMNISVGILNILHDSRIKKLMAIEPHSRIFNKKKYILKKINCMN